MASKAKRKGWEGEDQLEKLFNSAGFWARKHPMSGAFEGLKGDITVKKTRFGKMIGEVKIRKRGFEFLYDALGVHDFLAVRKVEHGTNQYTKSKPFLIIMTVDKFMELISPEKEAA